MIEQNIDLQNSLIDFEFDKSKNQLKILWEETDIIINMSEMNFNQFKNSFKEILLEEL